MLKTYNRLLWEQIEEAGFKDAMALFLSENIGNTWFRLLLFFLQVLYRGSNKSTLHQKMFFDTLWHCRNNRDLESEALVLSEKIT